MQVTLRPKVPMYCLQGVGPVCALGACSALPGARILWPQTVVVEGASAGEFALTTSGGFDDEGMFVRVSAEGLPEEAAAGIERAVASWESAIAEREGRVAGPLAPVLNDYVDLLIGFGEPAEALFPNGNIAARGSLVGMDVWGRATIRTASGRDAEYSPEEVTLRFA